MRKLTGWPQTATKKHPPLNKIEVVPSKITEKGDLNIVFLAKPLCEFKGH